VIAPRCTWCSCFNASLACYSWWLPPPRRLGAARIIERRLVIVFGSDRGDCEGFLTFPRWRAKRYSNGLLVACVIFILCWLCGTLLRVWHVMPLTHEPPSEWIATTRTSLLASKWTSVKKILCHLVPRISWYSLWLMVIILWLAHSSTWRYNLPSLSCIYFPSVAWPFSVASFEGKQVSV
jgi:hypothetical protein